MNSRSAKTSHCTIVHWSTKNHTPEHFLVQRAQFFNNSTQLDRQVKWVKTVMIHCPQVLTQPLTQQGPSPASKPGIASQSFSQSASHSLSQPIATQSLAQQGPSPASKLSIARHLTDLIRTRTNFRSSGGCEQTHVRFLCLGIFFITINDEEVRDCLNVMTFIGRTEALRLRD